jgi:hypothetical protein
MAKYEYHPIPPDPGVRLAPEEVDHISGIIVISLFIAIAINSSLCIIFSPLW